MCSPIKVGFLLLDVDRVEGVEPEPGGEGEARLVGPPGQGGHHHRAPRLTGEREEHVGARPEERKEKLPREKHLYLWQRGANKLPQIFCSSGQFKLLSLSLYLSK